MSKLQTAFTIGLLATATACSRPARKSSALPSSRIDASRSMGFDFLVAQQDTDGSWPSFRGTTRYPELMPDSRIFLNSIILGNLSGTRFSASDAAIKGRSYLLEQRSDNLLYNFDGRTHEYCCGRYQKIGAALPPDVDDTSLAYIALREAIELSADELGAIEEQYQRFAHSDDTFPTFMVGYHEGRLIDGLDEFPMQLGHDLAKSLGVNLNVLGFFAAHGIDVRALEDGIAGILNSPRYWLDIPYYNLAVNAQFAANAIELGSARAEEFLGRLLADFEKHTLGSHADLSALDLAAYLRAKSVHCRLGTHSCEDDLSAAREELLRRQLGDGSWRGGWVCTIGSRDADAAFSERQDVFIKEGLAAVRNYGFENLPEQALLATLAESEWRKDYAATREVLALLATRDHIADRRLMNLVLGNEDLASLAADTELRRRFYHYYSVLFEGSTRVHFNSPAVTTSFALRALGDRQAGLR